MIQELICIVPFWGSYSEAKGNSSWRIPGIYLDYVASFLFDFWHLVHVNLVFYT